MKNLFIPICIVILVTSFSNRVAAHCEIPCGIYNDSIRVELLKEHVVTIEKSMTLIKSLQTNPQEMNQVVRWVMNKEEHCTKIQDIATQYFMFQRIKIETDRHKAMHSVEQLSALHEICVYAMKCKQSIDIDNTKKLLKAIETFEEAYFGAHKHE